MSHSYETRIFTAPTEALPSGPLNAEQLAHVCQTAGADAYHRKDALHHVFGSTRGGYAIYTLKEVLKAKPFTALGFLTDTGHQYVLKGQSTQSLRVTVLDRPQQERTIAEFRQLFLDLAADPNAVYAAEKFGCLRAGDVEAALDRDYVSAMPAFDRTVSGDEGLGADYLFVYLRSVLTVIQNAYAEGKIVIHQLEL